MEKSISGRIWVLTDSQGELIEDIDTDQIYHNAYLHITEISEMGQYALGNLKGWEDFSKKAQPGDILIGGRNFGAGSSRQQAVDCFLSLRLAAVIAPSFGAIYFRNAVNSAFPVLKCSELKGHVEKGKMESGDRIEVNYRTGEGTVVNKRFDFFVEPMSDVQEGILRAGGLFNYEKTLNTT